ncbi:MAG: LysM peptidoglycan-binding domain-containing protein [Acidimicrobiia bacterium]|nr:LysM peptidoglycan-binding domain-containing protein [Acidimicrobiia bacterium]
MQSRTKKAVGAVAFAATLSGGAVVGALLGIPSVSDAAQPTATTAPSSTTAPKTDSSAPDDHKGPGRGGFGFEAFDLSAAAKALGISEDALKTRLAKGDTLAEIAKDQKVDVQKVVDALVAAGKKQIDQAAVDAKSHLEDRITDLVNNGFPDKGDHGGPGGPGGHFGFGLPDLSTVAKALGLSEDQLQAKLRSGQSLADIAKAQGVDVDKVVADVVKAVDAKIDAEVTAGHLDKDRAAEIKKDLEARITSFVKNGFPGPWGGPPRR